MSPVWYIVICDRRWQNANVQSHLRRNVLAASGKRGHVSSGLWLRSQSEATPAVREHRNVGRSTWRNTQDCQNANRPGALELFISRSHRWTPPPHPPAPQCCPSEQEMRRSHKPRMQALKLATATHHMGLKTKQNKKICVGKKIKWGRVGFDRLPKKVLRTYLRELCWNPAY